MIINLLHCRPSRDFTVCTTENFEVNEADYRKLLWPPVDRWPPLMSRRQRNQVFTCVPPSAISFSMREKTEFVLSKISTLAAGPGNPESQVAGALRISAVAQAADPAVPRAVQPD
jgi:hypothetical protein